jgi:hypothetical protein
VYVPQALAQFVKEPNRGQNWLAMFAVSVNTVHKYSINSGNQGDTPVAEEHSSGVKRHCSMLIWHFAIYNKLKLNYAASCDGNRNFNVSALCLAVQRLHLRV